MNRWNGVLIGVLWLVMLSGQAQANTAETEKVRDAMAVVHEIMAIPEKSIPPALLRNAYAVAVVPGVIKGAFVVGGRHGQGVICVRQSDGRFGPPAFISLTAGSVGFQFGAQSTDIILVFKSRVSVDGIIGGKFTIGADASAAAGPVGRHAAAGTTMTFQAQIYSYSRSRGLFAGLSLEGASLKIDRQANARFYRRPDIVAGELIYGWREPVPPVGANLQQILQQYSVAPPG